MADRTWRANRLALIAGALALLAGTPAILAAAGVKNSWVLAGATAAAAVIVVFSAVWQERYRRQRRDELELRIQDRCLIPPGGQAAVPRDVGAEPRERLSAGEFAPKLLIDKPARDAALGFRNIAVALGRLVSESEPQFAVGIFGGWGAGKTTLMAAIKDALPAETVVAVDFNAWRFEREPQILVPLLDSIRAALLQWSAQRTDIDIRVRARSVANRIGSVVRALAMAVSADIGLPGAFTLHYNVGTAIDALTPLEKSDEAESLYVGAFNELNKAFGELTQGGITRIAVFVDDLDRCLPENALEVLESIKLFFDLPGLVFIVGLDESVVGRAMRTKFGDLDRYRDLASNAGFGSARTLGSQRVGREYIKKIFQVQYALPTAVPQQLDDLLEAMYHDADLEPNQLQDLKQRVGPYINYAMTGRGINPREVKRFINAYILQTMVRPDVDPDTVLALQTLASRFEWQRLYDAILMDSALFVNSLRLYRQGEEYAFQELSEELRNLQPSLASYLRSSLAEPLLRFDSLDAYLSALQSTRTTSLWLYDASKETRRLRNDIKDILRQGTISLVRVESVAALGLELARNISSQPGVVFADEFPRLPPLIGEVRDIVRYLTDRADMDNSDEASDVTIRRSISALANALENLNGELQLLRDTSGAAG